MFDPYVLLPVRQRFPAVQVYDLEASMAAALRALDLAAKVLPGSRIAITAGSRGIRHIPQLLRQAANHLRSLGAIPVVVAAMGSHGGGTRTGQLAVLQSLGITSDSMGCEVVAGTAVVDLGRTAEGLPVVFDAFAAECDGILVINRVKAHTSFHGPLESGLVKMMAVGLGKAQGASQFHRSGPRGLSHVLESVGRFILDRMPILGGIAILENGREETADLVGVKPEGMIETERALLQRAKEMLPRLPAKALDLLVVEEMGKNFAGTGMDTNIIGRMGIHGVQDKEPDILRIAVLDLSDASHGNANGMGLADFITRRFAAKIDFHATYLNTTTATLVQRARMPMVLPSDQAVIKTALQTLGNPDDGAARILHIANTLMIEHLLASPALLCDMPTERITVEGPPVLVQFGSDGRLLTRVDSFAGTRN